MSQVSDRPTITAEPTKSFFVDMLTRDIQLDQAVLDLVDNSIDGAKRLAAANLGDFDERYVEINFDESEFGICDNCGGFSAEHAARYAFKFGRDPEQEATPHSIGQFGVGMKRALFKFGNHFVVQAATSNEVWAVEVDVEEWEKAPGWTFPWSELQDSWPVSTKKPGTKILVSDLRPEVRAKFASPGFERTIVETIKTRHRQFIAQGMKVSVNSQLVPASDVYLLLDQSTRPGVDTYTDSDSGIPVKVEIIVGLGNSSPREAGWYVVCNGRVILEADRRRETGWGLVEEVSNRVVVPSYHNQFARFRGIVTFDSSDSSRVPWNTTKTDVDQDSPVWRTAFERMTELMRPVIDFLNRLDRDIDDNTREGSPLYQSVKNAGIVPSSAISMDSSVFAPPKPSQTTPSQRTVKIQYSRSKAEVDELADALELNSAKAVGEYTFDSVLRQQRRS